MMNDLDVVAVRIAEIARARAVAMCFRPRVDDHAVAFEILRPMIHIVGGPHDQPEMVEPGGEEKYCRDCWDKKIAVEEIVGREFALNATSAPTARRNT